MFLPPPTPSVTARFLAHDDLDGLAEPEAFVEAVREGYRQRGNGAPAKPRTALLASAPPGLFTGYAAVLPDTGVMGAYTYAAGFTDEDAWFVMTLFDAESGRPLALLDGAWFNPFKTGAAGAVAVDELARRDASTLAIIGSGAQAAGQLRATATVREFDAVDVFSPTIDHREAFAARFDEHLSADVRGVPDAETAVRGADVVVTATDASEPVFDGSWLEPGTHVTAMGQYHPDRRELDHRTMERARYVPDLRERVEQDAGAFLSAREAGVVDDDHVHAELGEVVAGSSPGRTNDDQITVFDSGGTGIETVAGATLLYQRATERDRGTELPFAPASEVLTGE